MTIETRIALLEKDYQQVNVLCGKLDSTVQSLDKLITSISSMMTVHTMQIEENSAKDKELTKLLEYRRVEFLDELKIVHKRIDDHTAHDTIMHQNIRDDIKSLLNDFSKQFSKDHEDIKSRLNKLEKHIWVVYGGLFIFGFLLQIAPLFIKLFI